MDAAAARRALDDARNATLHLVDGLSDPQLGRTVSPLMSPLAWDLGHIAAYEDLWCVHRFGGRPLLRPDLAALYDAFETPRATRGDREFLCGDELRAYMAAVRVRCLEALDAAGAPDDVVHEMVVRHEWQHQETMRQTLFLAGLSGGRPPGDAWRPSGGDGLELVEVPAGPFAMGAGPAGFAFDNERPRHAVDVARFRIGRTLITNATWLTFVEGGGYERREWWSDEGWSWKEEYDITHPLGWSGAEDPGQPVLHVSWFEADAFARSRDARLPTEAEWEKAATWDQDPSPTPLLLDLGRAWEWTATTFAGYPGFRPHPYPEYSQVFFDQGYRVLRGGSWATSPRVATRTVRNWDWPDRRQIFSGVRLAQDAGAGRR